MNGMMQGLIGDNEKKVKTSRISAEARQALHIGTEDHLIQTFQAANECVNHDNCVTVKLKDLRLVEKMSNARTNY